MAALTAATSVPAAAGDAGERGGGACGPAYSPPQGARADSGLGAGTRDLDSAPPRATPSRRCARAHPCAPPGTECACACAALLLVRAVVDPPAHVADRGTEAGVGAAAGETVPVLSLSKRALSLISGPRSVFPGAHPRCGSCDTTPPLARPRSLPPPPPARGARGHPVAKAEPELCWAGDGAAPGVAVSPKSGELEGRAPYSWKPPWADRKGDTDSRVTSPWFPGSGLG